MMHDNFDLYLKEKWGLTSEEIERLSAEIETKHVSKSEFLLKKGDICTFFFFVEKGLLRFYGLNEDGKENILQFASENWLVSDRGSFYFNDPSHFFIDAVEDSIVVPIDTVLLDQISSISSSFTKNNDRLLHNHIRHLNRRVALLLGASAEHRYLDFIELHPDIMLRVPQWMVASYLGITPESLSRVRRGLADKNFSPK